LEVCRARTVAVAACGTVRGVRLDYGQDRRTHSRAHTGRAGQVRQGEARQRHDTGLEGIGPTRAVRNLNFTERDSNDLEISAGAMGDNIV
jgi:hypothetical protein